MKALVYTANEEMTYRDEPDPQAAPGDALIAIESVGICGSDMHAYLGHDERRVPPLILGHEAVGTVLEGASAGQRVLSGVPVEPRGALGEQQRRLAVPVVGDESAAQKATRY